MSHNQVNNVQDMLTCQDAELRISSLKEQLVEYKADMAIKDELQKQFNGLHRWVENAAATLQQTDTEQSNIINCQMDKMKKSELAEIALRGENDRLTDVVKNQTEKLKLLQRNEQSLRDDMDNMNVSKKKLETELFDTKVSLNIMYYLLTNHNSVYMAAFMNYTNIIINLLFRNHVQSV